MMNLQFRRIGRVVILMRYLYCYKFTPSTIVSKSQCARQKIRGALNNVDRDILVVYFAHLIGFVFYRLLFCAAHCNNYRAGAQAMPFRINNLVFQWIFVSLFVAKRL